MNSDFGHLNKESIQERMRRFALNYYGINQMELLDPVVNLFLESLSEEIYKLSGELENIENRIFDKLSEMLIPGIETIAKPAHTILHASPREESSLVVTTQTQFHYRNNTNKGRKKLHFYPVCNTRIYNGGVRYFIHGGLLYSVDKYMSKMLLARNRQNVTKRNNSFWIGVELDEAICDISELSFYFDFYGLYNKKEYYNLLPYTVWKVGGEEIPMYRGVSTVEEEYSNDTLRLFSEYDFSHRINNSIKDTYSNCFLTVKGGCNVEGKREFFPEALRSVFPENIVGRINKPLVWIEVLCPQSFSEEAVDSLQISINAFPVVNKELVSTISEVNKYLPLIPLKTKSNESFISIYNIVDSDGKRYYDIPVNDTGGNKYGIYSLRRGGCERYNMRDATEYLVNVIDTLNAKVSTFFRNKNDIKSDSKKIQEEVRQLIRGLEKKVAETKDRLEVENYVFVDPDRDTEIYFVDYWITNGVEANEIKAGVFFDMDSKLSILPLSVTTLAPVTGGKNAPQAIAKNSLYKKTLSENSLLITHEDITAFCKDEFHEMISDVKICNGFMKRSEAGRGFVRTTDIYMTPLKGMERYFRQDTSYFEKKLKEKSPVTCNYRIFINRQTNKELRNT